MIQLVDFEREPKTYAATAQIWNAGVPADLGFSPALIEFNTRETTGVIQVGKVAVDEGLPVGFVLATVGNSELFKGLSTLDI
ncbi:MAG TPA: hypothetical protein PKH92_11820, partial [Anaerolineaceae bacterium]|nr:hypothetical protein [Anaerolineaceae bacterium]